MWVEDSVYIHITHLRLLVLIGYYSEMIWLPLWFVITTPPCNSIYWWNEFSLMRDVARFSEPVFFFLPQNRILANHYNISWWNDREGEHVCPSRQPTGAQRLLCNVLVHTLITWPHRLPVSYTDGHGCTVMKVFAVPQQQPPSLPSLLALRPLIKREIMERSEIRG